MSEETRVPDLAGGIPSTDLPEGAMIAGTVSDEEVLIARVGGRLFAVAALCTHYHGPLVDGLLVGETVRCPWHHAHFCLRTGEALAAPAIDPLKRWAISEAGGVIRVGKALDETPTPPRRASAGEPRRVVVIGGGAAGFAAVEMLRRKGFDGSVTMLSADADAPYDRPNCSKDYLAGDAQPEWMPLRDASWYADHDIDLRLGTDAAALDPVAKSVTLGNGESLDYDALLIATGAEPIRPPIAGFDRPDAYVLRSLRDADAIIAAAGQAKCVAVVGASFIALETAAALRARGLEVHVAAPEAIPLARVMGDDIGRWVRGLHEQAGVVFHLGHGVTGWSDGRLALDDGTAIDADFLVLGMGVRPRVALAEAAGLAVDRGVMVDAQLRASAPGIYAAGDVARFPDPHNGQPIRIEHWVHAGRQGQHVARAILGDAAPFTDPPYFWSVHPGAEIRYIGHAEAFDPPHVGGSLAHHDAEVAFASGGRLLALATVGRDRRSLKIGVELTV
ncbi:FAD-dependent oxidoreductase [Sphingomonas lycopersici]|uniref:FAD-dependent oxidoreductase n=1 Tax=Sphingomonas lycopersici TaxID=2951807 RepID=A0AA42CPE6_9SPHN|nr:FAD-dependent oxidoreductase [Sphingomonas lycopersici]MCW6534274.1 FAD-dependent oxidoreductase [Sphingomonas lycopersici]